jgi:alcohol dehydrogenase
VHRTTFQTHGGLGYDWSLHWRSGHVIAGIDLADARLEAAKLFGADITLNNGLEDAVAIVQELTGGLGADVAIEAVGTAATFELAVDLARPGGHIATDGSRPT